MNSKTSKTQNGSAILWILIAVGLFAALGYAFSSSTRTSTDFITDAEAESYANQIIAYGNEVKAAVKRLQLRGCSDTEISFENNVSTIAIGYLNGTNKNCFIFDSNGGGLQFKIFSKNIVDPNNTATVASGETIFTGNTSVVGVGSDCNDASCNELVMLTPHLTESICKKINTLIGFLNDGDDIPEIDTTAIGTETFRLSNGPYKFESNREIHNSSTTILNNRKKGCVKGQIDPGTAGNHYFNVLIAR